MAAFKTFLCIIALRSLEWLIHIFSWLLNCLLGFSMSLAEDLRYARKSLQYPARSGVPMLPPRFRSPSYNASRIPFRLKDYSDDSSDNPHNLSMDQEVPVNERSRENKNEEILITNVSQPVSPLKKLHRQTSNNMQATNKRLSPKSAQCYIKPASYSTSDDSLTCKICTEVIQSSSQLLLHDLCQSCKDIISDDSTPEFLDDL